MGVVLGSFGVCTFFSVPSNTDDAQKRLDPLLRHELESYDKNVVIQKKQQNVFDATQQNFACCGVAGPGDWPYYHGI